VHLRVRHLVPLGIFLAISVFLAIGLTLDSHRVPSPLIGKPIPTFSLPSVASAAQTVRPADFRGEVWLLNVWATWCVSCRAEHEVLLKAARQHGLRIVGLDYKDERDAAKDWLRQRGDPYTVIAFDARGKAGLDLGVYGVPETYVIDRQGIIRHKFIGPLTGEDVRDTLLPLVQRLEEQA